MTQTGSWVIAIGVLVWFREIEPSDRTYWAWWAALSCLALVPVSVVLVFSNRVPVGWMYLSAGISVIFGGFFITWFPETFHGLPLHAIAVAAIVFSWLRLAAHLYPR